MAKNKCLNHFSDVMSVNYEKLFGEMKNSDLTLLVGESEFHVHRLILASHSAVFQKLIYNEFVNQIYVFEAPPVAFEKILWYLYSGKLDLNQDIHVLIEILDLARRFELKKLEDDLVDHVISLMSVENFMTIIKSVGTSEMVMEKCVEVQNEHDIFSSTGFLELNEEEAAPLFMHKDLIMTNMERFEAIAAWLKCHSGHSKSVHDQLLASIDLNKFTVQQIVERVRPTQLFDDDTLFDILLEKAELIQDSSLRAVEWYTRNQVAEVHEFLNSESSTFPKKLNAKVDFEPELIEGLTLETFYPVKCYNSNQGAAAMNDHSLFRPELVVGSNSEHLTSSSEFACAERLNGKWHLVIDLGHFLTFNYLEFSIGHTQSEHLSIQFSNTCALSADNIFGVDIWKPIKKYICGRRMQTIYMSSTTARYVRITGAKQINHFKVSIKEKLPAVQDNWIATENFETPPGWIEILDGNCRNVILDLPSQIGKNIKFFESHRGLKIRFDQPRLISTIQFHVMHSNSFLQNFLLKSEDVTGKITEVKHFRDAIGLQVVDIQSKAYCGFYFDKNSMATICIANFVVKLSPQ